MSEKGNIKESQEVKMADRRCFPYRDTKAELLLIQPIDEHDLEVLDQEVKGIKELSDKQHELLHKQKVHTVLEWNAGNYLIDSDKRTAKGFAWVLI